MLESLSPTYALSFFFGNLGEAFFALAAVVLAVTGAEALFADLGHFGADPITRAWLVLVFPACSLSYLGQGALIIDDPDGRDREPVLPAGARRAPRADGRAGHHGDRDRLPGRDHRCLLGGPAGGPARLPAAAADHQHLRRAAGPDLRAVDQLGADGGGAGAGLRLRVLRGAGLRLRDERVRHDHDHHAAVLLRRPHAVGRAPPGLVVVGAAFFLSVEACSWPPTSPRSRTARGCPCSSRSWSSPCSRPGSAAASW